MGVKISYSKKSQYIHLSLLFGFLLLIVDVMDYIATGSYLRPRITPFTWRFNIVVSSCSSYSWPPMMVLC